MELFDGLRTVRWDIAGRTYGNSHAALIGLLVDWWISRDATNCALEGGPSFSCGKRDMEGGNVCDAMFFTGPDAVGVLEVEGMRKTYTANKFERYFASDMNIRFGLLVLYSCGAADVAP